jgi:hypothetical protein
MNRFSEKPPQFWANDLAMISSELRAGLFKPVNPFSHQPVLSLASAYPVSLLRIKATTMV